MTNPTPRPLSVVVLAGGISHEREVSLRSGRRVADSLLEHGLEVELRDPDASLLEYLTQSQPDVVWPALHGASGEDGALRGLLRFMGIPFVGSDSESALLAWDKPTAKTLVARLGVSTPRSITLSRDAFRELGADAVFDAIRDELPFPLIVKPARGGSALGVTAVSAAEELPRAMVEAFNYDEVAVIEQQIIGTEVTVGVLDTGDGPVALPVVEIEPLSGVYDYQARYTAGMTRYYTPARITEVASDAAQQAALLAHRALGLRHLSRADIIIDGAGTPWFLESSVVPGLTETSALPLALEEAGHDLGWVFTTLAQAAAAEPG